MLKKILNFFRSLLTSTSTSKCEPIESINGKILINYENIKGDLKKGKNVIKKITFNSIEELLKKAIEDGMDKKYTELILKFNTLEDLLDHCQYDKEFSRKNFDTSDVEKCALSFDTKRLVTECVKNNYIQFVDKMDWNDLSITYLKELLNHNTAEYVEEAIKNGLTYLDKEDWDEILEIWTCFSKYRPDYENIKYILYGTDFRFESREELHTYCRTKNKGDKECYFCSISELLTQLSNDKAPSEIIIYVSKFVNLDDLLKDVKTNQTFIMWYLIHNYTQFIEICDWKKLEEINWSILLENNKKYIDYFDKSSNDNFVGECWKILLSSYPELIKFKK